MTIQETQNELIDTFALFDDWTQRYEYLIELGRELPIINPQYKTDSHLIKGCQSQVWLHAQLNNGKLTLTADSDAIITKGIVALLVRVFNNQTPTDILQADLSFIDKIGLKDHLSPTRANGLVSMIQKIREYARTQS
ncbi:SufE family protein [Capnocytophaga sp. oral taxon 878]|uniref:SufE family protein n=1 Tax=Capnocytophaga sp. oral taxon 878 TaxID=1316596 RepID=UPI000D0312A4|nr:SufE family protein [Capnocytophaga sp. oral taxon 878]AVM51028.1 Fe-S metabolism protein SufE [Capnocytophaga sp. oral taxon 878]